MTKDAKKQGPDADLEAKPEPPQFVGGKPRSREVLLDWPLRYDGKTYDRISVRRMTTAEVGEFIAAASGEGSKNTRLTMFDCPSEIIDALDPDDAERVNEVVRDFLPRLLRQADEPRPAGGANRSPSSRMNTPLPALLAMEWHELLAWHECAVAVGRIIERSPNSYIEKN